MSALEKTSSSATTEGVKASLTKRYAAEKRFKFYGIFAISASIAFLFILLASIVSKGLPAFTQTYVKLDVSLTADALGIPENATRDELRKANFSGVIKSSMRERFPDVKKRKEKKELYGLISTGAQYDLFDLLIENPAVIGTDVSLSLIHI